MKKYVISLAFALLSVGAFAHSKADTLVVSTSPKMHCENCENKIKKNIRFVKGTKEIETSVADQTVTIVYDARKADFKDYVSAFKQIGYEIKKKESAPASKH